jgi:hypothetical protein
MTVMFGETETAAATSEPTAPRSAPPVLQYGVSLDMDDIPPPVSTRF